MKITKRQLRQIIQEELAGVIREQDAEDKTTTQQTIEFETPVWVKGDPDMSPEELEALRLDNPFPEKMFLKHDIPAGYRDASNLGKK